LQGVLKEALLRTTGPLVLSEVLPPAVRGRPAAAGPGPSEADRVDVAAVIDSLLQLGENDLHAHVTAVVERMLFKRVLHATDGHLGRAAERLGLNRSTLRYKLRDVGLSVERVIGEERPA
jgi:two-component system nitrogen regulation response regulator GlnG